MRPSCDRRLDGSRTLALSAVLSLCAPLVLPAPAHAEDKPGPAPKPATPPATRPAAPATKPAAPVAKPAAPAAKPAPLEAGPLVPARGGKRGKRGKKPVAPVAAPKPNGSVLPAPFAAPPSGDGQELPAVERAATDCPDKIPPGKRFKLEFRGEVELKDLVTWAQATLCRPVLVPSTIRQQKIQIYTPATTTLPEAYRIFLAALNVMGLTVQPEGNALVIIETVRAKEVPVPFIGTDGRVPNDASYVTKVLRLKDVGTDEVVQVLQRLKSKDGDIIPYAPTGMLIITDAAENVRRMEEIVRLVDQPVLGGEKLWTVKLRNTKASDIAQLLEKVFIPKTQAAGANAGAARRAPPPSSTSTVTTPGGDASTTTTESSTPSLIIPEDKTNFLIIKANERTYRAMLALITRLEQSAASPVDAAGDRVHIYPLANANAEDMANTLSGLGVGVSGARGRTGGTATSSGTPATQPGGALSLFEADVKVAADKPTNSLVIIANGKDYYTLRDIIRKLDVSRRQVFIEATILEVSLDKARKIGAAFHGGGTSDTLGANGNPSLLFGGVEPNSSTNSLLFSPLALSGLAAGLRGPNIPGAADLLGLTPGTSVPAFGVFLQALQNNNDVNVVSLPHILTTDNEKANIEVGQNLPFPGMLGSGLGQLGALAGAAGAAGTGALGALGGIGLGTSVQRQDVALKLEITPHVNDSDLVRLEVDNEISDVSSPNYNGLGPATNKRKVKTVVVVRDQQPVVLGGLIKDRVSESVDKVPLLGDIPILGYLFKYNNRSVTKQNLLIIITPYVIKDPQDLRRIFERKVAERRDFLERFSSFRDDRDYDAGNDYRHKRGLLEEINRTAVEIEREAADLRAAEQNARARMFEGPVEVPPALPPATPPPARGGAPRGDGAPAPAAPGAPAAPPARPANASSSWTPPPPPFFVQPPVEGEQTAAATPSPPPRAKGPAPAAPAPSPGPDTTNRGEVP